MRFDERKNLWLPEVEETKNKDIGEDNTLDFAIYERYAFVIDQPLTPFECLRRNYLREPISFEY